MLKDTAVSYFKGVPGVARALDISDAAVYQWPEVVPLESAIALEMLTKGDLPVDRKRYPKIKRASQILKRQASH
jgi:hypothetical protein